MMLHCTTCQVEWRGKSPESPCWICGEQGEEGLDKTSCWTSSMTSEPLIGSWDRIDRSA